MPELIHGIFHLFSSLFHLDLSIFVALTSLLVNILTIVGFVIEYIKQDKKIQNLNQQLIAVSNQTSLEVVQNQIKGVTEEQLQRILDSYNKYNEMLYEKTNENLKLLDDKISKAEYDEIIEEEDGSYSIVKHSIGDMNLSSR